MAEPDRSLSTLVTSLERPAPLATQGAPSDILPTVWTMLRDAGLESIEASESVAIETVRDREPFVGASSTDADDAQQDAFAARLTAAFHSGALAARTHPVAGSLGQITRQISAPSLEVFTMPRSVRRPAPGGREAPRTRYTPISNIGRPLYTPW